MAQYLDFFPDPGSKRAATRLVALGAVSAVPTAMSGWAEWALADRATRRVGIGHAFANGAATVVFATSWGARVQGRHGLGDRLVQLGGVLLLAGAMLGGHMGVRPQCRGAHHPCGWADGLRSLPLFPGSQGPSAVPTRVTVDASPAEVPLADKILPHPRMLKLALRGPKTGTSTLWPDAGH